MKLENANLNRSLDLGNQTPASFKSVPAEGEPPMSDFFILKSDRATPGN